MDITIIYQRLPTEEECIKHMEIIRWNGNPKCPYCNSYNFSQNAKKYRKHCNDCNTTYSVTVGTLFHHTHLPLQKWFMALALTLNTKQRISTRKLAYMLDINKNTAYVMLKNIRKAAFEQDNFLFRLIETDIINNLTAQNTSASICINIESTRTF